MQNRQVLVITSQISQPPKSLAHIGSEKSFVEPGVLKSELFHMFRFTEKFIFHPEPWVV